MCAQASTYYMYCNTKSKDSWIINLQEKKLGDDGLDDDGEQRRVG